jgi:hypothetical protein
VFLIGELGSTLSRGTPAEIAASLHAAQGIPRPTAADLHLHPSRPAA